MVDEEGAEINTKTGGDYLAPSGTGLAALIEHAAYARANLPFYRDLYSGIDLDRIDTWESYRSALPMIAKEDLIAAQGNGVEGFLGRGLGDVSRIYYSAGPFACALTEADVTGYAESYAEALRTSGVGSSDVVDVTVGYHWSQGCAVDDGFRTIGCAVLPGGAGLSDTHIEAVQHCSVSVLFTFPSFAENLIRATREAGLDPHELGLRLVVMAGEQHGDRLAAVAEAFGASAAEVYGTSDLGLVAASCGESPGMHLMPRYVVELIDPYDGTPAGPDAGGELVISECFKEAQPIIRMRTGDIVERLYLEPCPCGRATPRMSRVIGRADNTLRAKGQFVSSPQLERAMASVPGLTGRFRLTVERPDIQDVVTLEVDLEDPGRDIDLDDVARRAQAVMRIRPDHVRKAVAVEEIEMRDLRTYE